MSMYVKMCAIVVIVSKDGLDMWNCVILLLILVDMSVNMLRGMFSEHGFWHI